MSSSVGGYPVTKIWTTLGLTFDASSWSERDSSTSAGAGEAEAADCAKAPVGRKKKRSERATGAERISFIRSRDRSMRGGYRRFRRKRSSKRRNEGNEDERRQFARKRA